ncbi:TPM domain-containing protein [Pseudorhodobacter ferrugineus]|uniref:TPM domain-containing protein n=1 Tax=Pseudorhodobacter ferrugineus TaxID=77008 RepID=UPI0003B64567|nr:TPM domain-containing protein [Pseudorhodobacter ferrugineus]
MLRILCLMLFLPVAALAQSFPAPLSDTVSDYADLLPPEAEARVAQALQAARNETGVHIVLAVIGSQADYGGTGRFADFATAWFNAWGIGDATRNDGILILVAKEDREMRIALGRAYDVMWDGRAQRVVDTAMLPAFRNENYAKGLEDGAMLAIDQLARPFAAKAVVTEDSGFPEESPVPAVMEGVMAVLMGLGVVWAVFRRQFGAMVLRWKRCQNCGARSLRMVHEVTLEPGETTPGEAVDHRRCGSCGNDEPTVRILPSKADARAARASSSSSSGFGGGSSGGGGASGKW